MRRWPATWGWPGAVALAALLAAAVLGGLLAPHWQAQALAEAAQQIRAPRIAPTPRPAVTAARALPPAGDSAERVAALLRLAPRHGVQLERTQQRVSRSGGVLRLQVGLAAKGRYAALRSFVAAALHADAGLALDQLQLRRDGIDGELLEAELEWSLFETVSEAARPAMDT